MQGLWDEKANLYAPRTGATTYTYSPALIADVVGAFNVATNVLGKDVKDLYGRLFISAVDDSGLIAAQLENTQSVNSQTPLPPRAGGTYGQAPVFLSEATYDTSADSWTVTDGRFTTAEAMHLANELLWYGYWGGRPTEGPPKYGLPFAGASKQGS